MVKRMNLFPKIKKELMLLQAKYDGASERCKMLKEQNEVLQAQYDEKYAYCKSLEEEIQKRKEEEDQLELKCAMQDVNIAHYLEIAESCKKNAEYYREIIDAKENRIAEKDAEIERLKKEVFELKTKIPDNFPVGELMDTCAKAAWLGKHSVRKFMSDDGVQLIFEGTIYEPSYESFSAGCNVFCVDENGVKKILHSIDDKSTGPYRKEVIEVGSADAVRDFILASNVAFKEVL